MPPPDIAERFAQCVGRHPGQLAVASGAARLTYRELDDAVARLAGAIAATTRDGPVAVMLPHGASLATGLLAGLRAGRVVVPIDPGTPAPRCAEMLADAGVSAVLASGPTGIEIEPRPGGRATIEHMRVTAPDRVAMILYTSGSTGGPKGVVYSHARIIERIVRRDRFGLQPGDRVGVFGAAGMHLVRTLLSGAALLSWDLTRDGVAGIADWIEREALTILHGIPTIFRRLGDLLGERRLFPRLRCVSVTGEPLLRHDVTVLRRLFPPPCVLVNGLGTTEAGTFCQWTIDPDALAGDETVPVGFPVEGCEVRLVDDAGAPATTGEIVVCGDLLGIGYWNRPAVEAARFPAAGVYRTGDLGRRRVDGALLHLGRRDLQLKIRGVRIEAAEVEGVLLAHPEVREAAVVGDDDPVRGMRLVACVAAPDRRPGLARELTRFARERLPDAMVPEGWTFVAALPTVAGGKVDRRALPAPVPLRARAGPGLVARFTEQVVRSPGATAFRDASGPLTFTDLDRRSAALATRLRAHGVGRETVVGIAVDRDVMHPICMLGVLRAGGACLPLDPHGPRERNASMLRASGARWLLARPDCDLDVGPGVRRIDPSIAPDERVVPLPAVADDPDRLAFVLFTSGSTGAPKGVELTERQILHRVGWDWTTRPFAPGEVACQRGATGFVDALAEWLGPLLQSVPTVIVGDDLLRRPRALVDALAATGVTRILLVPSQLDLLLDTVDELGARLPALRLWTTSGEPLGHATVEHFRRALPGAVLWNVYGATEAWDATCHHITGDTTTVPIGRPLPGMRAYVLDEGLAPMPIGVAGELYVAGEGLARGYRDDVDLTHARFLPNPFAPDVKDRLYRTGDRARWCEDGTLEHLGRTDRQVKLLGVRVELGEVEAALAACPAVREAAVVAVGRRLIAYVVPEPGRALDLEHVRRDLRVRLPAVAVPREVVTLAALPRNVRGKIDRIALAAGPAGPQHTPSAHVRDAGPSTEFEQTLIQVIADILQRESIGVTDDFFDLGGDSLLAVRLIAEIEALTGRTVPLEVLALAPTARGLADAVTGGGFGWASDGCLTLHPDGQQLPLFGICGAWGYAVRLLRLGRALGRDVPLHALQPPDMQWPPAADMCAIGAHYAREIERLHPAGPYRLVGTSVGGVIAFEVALQLEARGRHVALIAMVDSALPGARLQPLADGNVAGTSAIEQAGRRVYMAHLRAVADYRPARLLDAPLLYFLCNDLVHDHHVGWQRLARRPVTVIPVPGTHGAFHTEPQLGVIARQLGAILRVHPA